MAFLLVQEIKGPARRVEIDAATFVIGKRRTNNLILDRPNISREHCVILQRNGGYFLRDLGSRNGTFLNEQRVTADTRLRDGDRIHLGDFLIVFREEAGIPASTTSTPAEGKPAASASGPAPAAVKPEPRLAEKPAAPVAEAPVTTEHAAVGAAPAKVVTAAPSSRRIPVELKRRLHEVILERLDLKHSDLLQKSREELWKQAAEVARAGLEQIRSDMPDWLTPERLIKEVVDEAVALGPIEDLLADPEVDEIMVNGCERVYVERHGKIELTDKQFTSNEHLLATIRRILAPIGRRIDESSPMVDARLADGSRVNAIIAPVCLTGPTLTIRKFARTPFTIKDLLAFGSLSQQMADFFKLCVESRRNICISGGTGSGKTTLLNVISSFLGANERIVTIEDAAELKLWQEHVISLEAKPPNIEGKGAIPIRKLVINSLRMRPDRIIVGECRGGEALDMLQAMNTGHDGSLTTVHANSVRDSLARLETMVLMAGMDLPSRAIREQIASAIHIIIQTARLPDGSRKVVEVAELLGLEGDTFVLQTLYLFKQRGFSTDGRVQGDFVATGAIPRFIEGLRERGIHVDLKMFAPPKTLATA